MGKDLKGRELGVGIVQKKDGRYSARYSTIDGKRVEKCFHTFKEARNWIAIADADGKENDIRRKDMTYDEWFTFWRDNVLKNKVVDGTYMSYIIRYNTYIKPAIGGFKIKNIKPIHCQSVVNTCIEKGMSKSTITTVRVVMTTSFKSAVDNGIIDKSPMLISEKVVLPPREEKKSYLTIDEQKTLTDYLTERSWKEKDNQIFLALLLIMQTGMRIGELMALRWEDVDYSKRELRIIHSMNRISYTRDGYSLGDTKSKSGRRMIPLTKDAIGIFNRLKHVEGRCDKFNGLIFLGKDGKPFSHATYNRCLTKALEKVGVENISVHGLRHTFATRCIESGIAPKTLQEFLGHNSISTTMNLYVHVSELEKISAINLLENLLA